MVVVADLNRVVAGKDASTSKLYASCCELVHLLCGWWPGTCSFCRTSNKPKLAEFFDFSQWRNFRWLSYYLFTKSTVSKLRRLLLGSEAKTGSGRPIELAKHIAIPSE